MRAHLSHFSRFIYRAPLQLADAVVGAKHGHHQGAGVGGEGGLIDGTHPGTIGRFLHHHNLVVEHVRQHDGRVGGNQHIVGCITYGVVDDVDDFALPLVVEMGLCRRLPRLAELLAM